MALSCRVCSFVARRPVTWSAVIAACSVCLHGCDIVVPRHKYGNWEVKPNYLTTFQYVPPTGTTAYLNSCMAPGTPKALQCSGHGKCRGWNDVQPNANPDIQRIAFCECDKEWADPECTTPRKSQMTAFILSVFLGFLGVDQFYLGYLTLGLIKLVTLGGFGLWYLFDIVRIGSTTVSTHYNFQVANDFPHFAFVLCITLYVMCVGFGLGVYNISKERIKKAHEVMLLRSLEDTDVSLEGESQEYDQFVENEEGKVEASSLYQSQPVFRGYGSTFDTKPMATMAPTPTSMPPMGTMPMPYSNAAVR